MSVIACSLISRQLLLHSKNVRCMSYKSSLSLDKIYPNSKNINPYKPPEITSEKFTGWNERVKYPNSDNKEIAFLFNEYLGIRYIPIKELEITTTAASGPGGQHVNKTETKVDIRFHVKSATWLSEDTKQKLADKFSHRMNKKGYFIIRSEKTRSQILNQAEAINYLRQIIYDLEKPESVASWDTMEKHRKNLEKAARQRLMEKRTRALIKSGRGSV